MERKEAHKNLKKLIGVFHDEKTAFREFFEVGKLMS
jgi:hypothetical protein